MLFAKYLATELYISIAIWNLFRITSGLDATGEERLIEYLELRYSITPICHIDAAHDRTLDVQGVRTLDTLPYI